MAVRFVAVGLERGRWAKPSEASQLRAAGSVTGAPTLMSLVRAFADDADIPDTWDCPRCGLPAGQDRETPPSAPKNEPYKTHLAYVKERRSDADGEAILAEALAKLRGRA